MSDFSLFGDAQPPEPRPPRDEPPPRPAADAPLALHGLAVSAGVTLYVAASNLIPEVQKGRRPGLALAVCVGAALFYVTFLMLRGVVR